MGEAARKIDSDEPPANKGKRWGSQGNVAAIRPYQWQPGKSGNPSGRGKKLIHEIEQLTDGGLEMIHAMINLMRGKKWPGFTRRPSYMLVFEATKWLAEQKFGKAPLMVQNQDGERTDFLELIYKELTKTNGAEGVFDLKPEHTIDAEWVETPRGQDLAPKQSVQDTVKDRRPEV